MILNKNQKELCEQIDYSFVDLHLLEQALVHSSLKSRGPMNNQRMEFLGDRILGFIIADYLFRNYSNWREGTLALNFNSLVCKEACAEIAESIDLGKSKSANLDSDLGIRFGLKREVPLVYDQSIQKLEIQSGIYMNETLQRNLERELEYYNSMNTAIKDFENFRCNNNYE